MRLSCIRDYWLNDFNLNSAIPATQVFLDYVPPGIDMPYVRLTVINWTREDTTGGKDDTHIENLQYQFSVFSLDLDALTTLMETVILEFDNADIDTGYTLRNRRTKRLMFGEVINGAYTYHGILEYELTSNSSDSHV